MVKKLLLILILIPVILLLPYAQAVAITPFQGLVAGSALLAEADSGEILFELDMRIRHPVDSLTRIMTLLLAVTAVENGDADLGDIIEMTETAWDASGVSRASPPISTGEEIALLDLMYCAFVGNSSEACNLLAEHISGSIDRFIEQMNNKASELGCEDTRFVNTHGQYNERQYTTARDLFIIYSEAMKNELFAEISGAFRYTTGSTNRYESRTLTSSNSLLNQNTKYFFRYCVSGIASATFEGGHSLVSYSEADGLSLIAVVLGSDVLMLPDESADMRNLSESRRLYEWGFSQFGWQTVLASSELVDKVPITHGAGADFVNVRPESSVTLLLDKDIEPEAFHRKIIIFSEQRNRQLFAPISAGDVLGELKLLQCVHTINRVIGHKCARYYCNVDIDGVEIASISLIANTNIDLHSFQYIRMQVSEIMSSDIARNIIIALSVLLLLYIALVVRYNIIRSKRLRMIKAAKKKLADERRQVNNDFQ